MYFISDFRFTVKYDQNRDSLVYRAEKILF